MENLKGEKILRNRYFQDLLIKVESKLKRILGKEYNGLFSIAREITCLYLYKHQHLYYKEHEYITELRKDLLTIEMLGFFSTNYTQFKKQFNFKKVLTKIEAELYKIKKIILYKWLLGETEKELEELKKGNKLDTYKKMYLNLLRNYPTFKVNELKKFKKELGL